MCLNVMLAAFLDSAATCKDVEEMFPRVDMFTYSPLRSDNVFFDAELLHPVFPCEKSIDHCILRITEQYFLWYTILMFLDFPFIHTASSLR